jgi:predicted metalloprotease
MSIIANIVRATGVIAITAVAGLGVVSGTAQAAEPSGCTSLERCYGYADMQSFYDEVIVLIAEFSSASYQAMPAPTAFVYIPHAAQAPTGCGPADENAFFYCRGNGDRSVYIGQDEIWSFYQADGDAAAAFGIAHEWGHHIQTMAGIFDGIPSSDQAGRIRAENQADCIGGAFIGHLDKRGLLESEDYSDIDKIISKIASAENDPARDHGTLQERVNSVVHGLRNGLTGCNDYFPTAPLHT